MKRFSKEIQKYRFENNISQEKFANIMNVSRQLVSKWETGSSIPNSEDLLTLSKLFNIDVEELLSDIEDNNSTNQIEPKKRKINFKFLCAIIISGMIVLALVITLPIVIINNNKSNDLDNDINSNDPIDGSSNSNSSSDADNSSSFSDALNIELIEYSKYTKENNQYICIDSIDLKEIDRFIIPAKINGIEVGKISDNAIKHAEDLIELTIPFVGEEKESDDQLEFKTIFNNSIVPDGLSHLIINTTDTIPEGSLKSVKVSKVTLEDSVKYINKSAFQSSSIENVILPESLESIGEFAFENTKITSVTIPSMNKLSEGTFRGCKKLKDVTIEDGMTSIGQSAFSNCESLINIYIPDTVEIIESFAFNFCYRIESLILPSKLTKISSGTFHSCASLKSIEIPEKVDSIESIAFMMCTSLKEIKLPDNVLSLGDSAFESSGLETIELNKALSSMGKYCFRGTKIGTIDLSDTKVLKIENSTFSDCSNLSNVIMSNSITTIDEDVFMNCTSLESFTVPNSVLSIGNNAFYATNIERLAITNPNTSVGQSILYQNEVIEFLQLPSLDNRLSWYFSFDIPDSLSEVIILNETELPSSAFSNSKIKKITLPNNLLTINFNAFKECVELEEVIIPNGVTTIGNHAFADCSKLKRISIPNSVTDIDDFAFSGCSMLKTLVIPEGVTKLDSFVISGSGIEEVIVHKNIENVDSYINADIFYLSNEDDWENVEYYGDGSNIYFYSNERPSTSGNYWYYDLEGNVCKW